MEDTDAATEAKTPVIALVGRYQLPKCLDIAVQRMKQGEEATVNCPNYLDLGGRTKNNWSSNYKAGRNTWLNNKIDTTYELKVQECRRSPRYFKTDDHLETLSAGYPFYFLSANKDKDGNLMALSVDEADLYAPRKTGCHNVKLMPWKGRKGADKR